NDKGTQVMVQVYDGGIDPKLIQGELDKALRKAFEGKLVKDSDKPAKRKLVGEERTGITMDFEVVKGVTTNVEFYAFKAPSNKRTLAAMFQFSPFDADAAKKGFAVIADSLEEAK